jgi:hypothetical protein
MNPSLAQKLRVAAELSGEPIFQGEDFDKVVALTIDHDAGRDVSAGAREAVLDCVTRLLVAVQAVAHRDDVRERLGELTGIEREVSAFLKDADGSPFELLLQLAEGAATP